MALYFDRARMTTATSGTGTITLGAAVPGYRTFSGAGVLDGNVVAYAIEEGTNWEVGTGTYTQTGTTLSRVPTASSAGGGAITLTGTAQVYITARAADIQNTATSYYSAGPDVTVTDGGTGASTVSGALTNLGVIGRTECMIWADEFIPALSNGAQIAVRAMTTNGQVLIYAAFDTSVQETVYMRWMPPKSYNGGTITFVPIWTAQSSSGTAEFELSGVACSNDDPLDAAFGTAVPSNDTLLSVNDLHVGPESTAVTLAGTFADGDFVWLRIQRDVATDTLGADAELIAIKLFYTTARGNDA